MSESDIAHYTQLTSLLNRSVVPNGIIGRLSPGKNSKANKNSNLHVNKFFRDKVEENQCFLTEDIYNIKTNNFKANIPYRELNKDFDSLTDSLDKESVLNENITISPIRVITPHKFQEKTNLLY